MNTFARHYTIVLSLTTPIGIIIPLYNYKCIYWWHYSHRIVTSTTNLVPSRVSTTSGKSLYNLYANCSYAGFLASHLSWFQTILVAGYSYKPIQTGYFLSSPHSHRVKDMGLYLVAPPESGPCQW